MPSRGFAVLLACVLACAASASAVCVVYYNANLLGRGAGFVTWHLEDCVEGAGAVINGSYVLTESTNTPTSMLYGEQLCGTLPTDDTYFQSGQDDLTGEASATWEYTTTYASVFTKAKLVCTATVGSCLIDVVTVCLNNAEPDARVEMVAHGFTFERSQRHI